MENFLVAERLSRRKAGPKTVTYDLKTFLKASVSIVITDVKQFGTTQTKFITTLVEVMGSAIGDLGSCLLPFQSDETFLPDQVIGFKVRIPTQKNKLIHYVSEIKMKWAGHDTTDASFFIEHSKPIEEILNGKRVTDTLDRTQSLLEVDLLQCGARICVGVLLEGRFQQACQSYET